MFLIHLPQELMQCDGPPTFSAFRRPLIIIVGAIKILNINSKTSWLIPGEELDFLIALTYLRQR